MKIAMLVPVGSVPMGAVVTKPTGTFRFKRIEKVRIHGAQDLESNATAVLLEEMEHENRYQMMGASTLVKWEPSPEEAAQFLFNHFGDELSEVYEWEPRRWNEE